MAQQFKVLINAGKDQAPQTLQAEQGAGQRGRPLIIKAKAGAKYQLVEQGKGRGNDLAPDNIKAKRVGKHLHLMFETDTVADVIIEDYYDVMPEGYNGVIGKAENGSFYEYLTEDPTDPGLIPLLKDNATAVTQALGGAEVSPAGAAVAFAAFPLLGALGLLGGAAAVAAAVKDNGTTTNTTTGKLDANAPNDSGVLGDNRTNDATPTLSGTVPTGSTATVTINGQTYPVTVNPNGTWSFTNPTNLPDGTYYPVLNVTTNGVTTPTNLTPFTIDTVTTVNIGNPGKVGATDPISGTAEPGDTVVVKDANGQVIGTATANSAGVWSLTPSAPVPAGAITATATDAAGNTATDTDTPVSGNVSLKTALTIDPIAADNVLLASESGATTYTVTGKVTGTFAAGDVVFLTLNGKTYPAVVKADGTYSVAVPMSELKADPDTKIEGSINPTGGDPATAAQDYNVESGNVATQTALSIDPVTADNIINSTEGTGNIAITGKVTGKFSAGDTVTLTVNNKTFTGQAAADGSYSIAVPAADLKADADTQVDGTVTGTGGTLAKAIQDYGVDANVNPAPPASLKTALTIDPIAADNVLLANESGATTYTVTGKVTGAFAAGDVVFLSLNGKTYPAIVNADGTYSTLVSMADLKADPDTKIEGTITPTGGDIATAAQDYTVEAGNVATQTALSIDPVTADNIIGSSESSGSITLTGKVTGKFSAGDVVKLTVAGVTYSGTAAADGSYSIPVSAASLLADSDTQVDGTVTGTGGTLAKAVQDYGIAPSINPNGNSTGALTPTAPNDSGVVGDNTTNDNTPSLSGKVPTSSSATVTINGQTYPVTVNPDGTWSFTQPTNLPDGTYYPVLNVTTGGVTTPTNLTPFTIDTTPPTVAVTSNAAALAAGETATITFTLSEKSNDFTADDIAVTGGTLSNFQQSATDPKVYTATFTPSSTGTSATVSVASDKFADAAANRNTDGAEANNTVSFKTNATVTGALTATAPNDSGVVGDNTTNDTTPTLNGKVPSGSTATVTLNGQTYPVTVNPDGTWSFTNPTNLPDGTYTPQLNVTTNGVTTTTPITPFTIDTTPPTVIVTSGSSSLASGQTANITFTLSEVVSDFSNGDITVAGGTLSNLVQSATDPKVYTAVFTPTSTSANALATIGVASDKFSDAAANFNKDTLISPAPAGATYEANNSVTLTTNATVSGQLSGASDNSTGTPNDHKTNDATPELTGKVPPGSTATVTINGQTYPVTVAPDGSWTFTQPTNLPDGTYTPVLNVTTNGVTTPTNITPFTIDTTPPTVAITGTTNTLAAGQSTTLTFTLSEASNDLSGGDFVVAGGTLSALQQSATDPKVYTATFTATPGTTTASTATVSIASDKFADAAGNLNKDGADANNLWTSSITPATAPQPPASAKTALTIDPITGDNVVTLSESGAAIYTVTGKVTGTFAAGDLVTLRLNDKPFYATVLADGTYSTVVPMADIKADSDTKIEGSVTGTGGQYATAAQDYTVETTNAVTQTALSINAVTADNIIGSTESTGSIAITGKVTGKFVAGDIVTLTVKGINYSGTAAADGSYSIPVPAAELIADSDTAVDGTVTGTGGTLAKAVQDYGVDPNINPAQVDTTPPKIAISSNQASLLAGQTATITFTVSEATSDFSWDGSTGDIAVTGGTLGALTHVGVNAAGEDIYTAVFTPATNSTTPATIAVAAGKFRDTSGNQNLDTYNATADTVSGHLVETNNIVTLSVNTTTVAAALNLANDTATAVEAGGAYSATGGATAGTNPAMAAASGVLSNDTGTTPTVTGIQKLSATSATTVTAGTTSGTGTSIVGQYGTLKIGADGSYTYTVNNTDAAVQALRTSANTVTDVFTYTASDASGNKTANLVVTVQGANDAPTVVIQETDKTLTAGTALTPFSVINNFNDVDSGANGETATYSAAITGGGTWPSWLTFNAATGLFTGTPPTAGTTSVDVTRTDALGLTATDTFLITVNPAVDTTPPKIAISSNQASLTTGQTATITFTVSEATSDFSWDGSTGDIAVTGGTLGALTHVGVNAAGEDIYTAVFTPATNSTTPATIAVAAGKFRDTSGNQNLDTYNATADTVSGHLVETNNIVTLSVNTTTVAAALNLANDTATAVEAGGAYSATGGATAGTNPAMAAASGVLSNDTGTTPTVTGIQKLSATSATTVTAGTTSGTGTSIVGQYGTLKIGADGSYTYTVNNTDAAVQALRTSANTVTDVFTYTASDASGNKTANLVVTVQGANDAPTVVIQETDKTLTAGTALTPFSVINNFNDVDSGANGETATYSAAITGGGTWPSWLTFNPATGLFTGTPPTAGVTSVDITRTDALGLTATDTFLITVNPAVDTTPPKIAISSNQASLTTGQTATITFTVSEATSDFSWDGSTGDIVVTGGALGALTHVGVNAAGEDIYTAVFTPAANSTTPATIAVAAGKFRDAAGNQNLDTYNATADSVAGHIVETNNIVTLTVNTTTVAAALVLANDSASALEAGGTANGTAGNNASGSVLTNDVGATPKVTGVQKITDTTATTVSANTTSSTGTSITGQYGTLVMGADGSYIYTIDNNNATVQSLKGSTNTLTEVFTYTANDGTGAKTANLVVTVQGANDAPVAVADVASATEAGGVANGTPGVNPTGNVLTNDTDVDLADTQAVSAIMAGIAGTPSPVTAANAAADTTGITGAHGTLKIGTDGSYSYTVNQSDAAVEALLPTSTPLTDTFTYTVKDAAGLTSTQTIVISINGAIDVPAVNNSTATIDIVSATTDTGASSTDFITSDQTLSYAGTVTGWVPGLGDRVMLEFTDPLTGSVTTAFATPSSTGAWTWTDTSRNPGTYILKATIVSATGTTAINTAVPVNGTNGGYDIQPVVIDTSAGTPAEINLGLSITTDANNNAFVNTTELGAATTFTSRATFDPTLAKVGMVITLSDGTTSTPITLTQAMVTAGYVEATFAKPAEGAVQTVTAKLTDIAGNVGTATVSDSATLDTTAITVAVTRAGSGTVTTSEVITFTLSEASPDFAAANVDVTGGTLSNWTKVDATHYTATFTPTAGSNGTATVGVTFDKFSDTAGNQNKDTYVSSPASGYVNDGNNIQSFAFDTRVSASLALSNDTATAVEAGGTANGTAGTNPAIAATSGVLSNDTGTTPTVTGIQKISDTTATSVAAGSTGGTGGTPIAGQYGTLVMGADGSYVYTVNNDNATVQALRTTANTLTDVFTYTAADASGTKTANLVVTVQGANDAPTVTVQEPDKALTLGEALTPFSVLSNFADVDSGANGETATYSAAITGGGTWPSWLTFNASTGSFSGTPPSAGTTSVTVTRTDALSLSVSDTFNIVVNPVVDTTPPTIAISSNQSSLASGQTATITFTISEATTDFAWDGTSGDIEVTGGTLSALTHVGVNAAGEDIYTAVFTPATNSTTPAVIRVAAGKFHDAVGQENKDTWNSADTVTGKVVETNNSVTLTVNTANAAATLAAVNDTATAIEAGTSLGSNVTKTAAQGVLSNDSGTSPTVSGVQLVSDASSTPVSASSTSANGTSITGQYGTLVMGADGSYIYNVDNTNPIVQALRTNGQTLTESFTYTITDATGNKTANLAITVQGANDAVTAVADTATATEAGGTSNGTAGNNPAGNVLSNDTDVDLGDTKVVQDIRPGSGGTVGALSPVTAGSTSTSLGGAAGANATGSYGSLLMGADGSYIYSVDNSNATVQALRTSSQTLTDTFTYTVKDTTGATSTNTITVTVGGANDAPTVTTAIADTTGTIGTALTSFAVVSNFADVDTVANGETATYSAQLVDSSGNLVNGGALPSWLQIDPSTGTFSGTAPVGTTAGDIYIRAIRTDAGGLTASDDFKITLSAAAITTTVSFSSMTKDSGTTPAATANADWTTNDASAGRLVSGQISAPLAAGEVVKVYANNVEVGTAVVNGTQWEITDLKDYNANWTYTAQVVGAGNNLGPISANRLVTLDPTEAPPVITGVFDTASSATTIANNGSTSNALSTVKGTGQAGDKIFLYDNTYTNLVGTAVVDSNGDWSVTTLTNTFGGINTFAAKQVDVNGNQSGLSNQWTVTTPATALNANSGFSSGMVDYTTKITPIVIQTPSSGTDDTAYIWGGNRIGVIDLQSYYQPNYSTTNPTAGVSGALPIQVGAGALSAATAPATWSNGTWTQKTYTFGADSDLYTAAWKTFASLASGKILAGSADGMLGNDGNASSSSNLGDLWRSSASVVAGKTYEFSFAYWNTVAKNLNTAGFMDVMIDGQKAMTTTNNTTGKVSITYTATTTGSIDLALQTWSNQNSADFVLDNLVFSEVAPPNTLGSTTAGNGPTANPDNLSYTNGALDALASDDTITATSNTLQATLTAGGMISGGAGVDTLKLAAGTTLNLGTLTTNQTVRNIEQIEIIEMVGTSALSMTANDVLSLGGTNTGSTIGTSTSASPMAPYSFATTVQSNDTAGGANTVPTGSTSSAGKVQMVVHGVTGDTLNLNKLAVDGTTPAGNTGLDGFWAYKGKVLIGGITYKVYDHSTTQAQVLVDVAVTMNVDPATVTNTTATIDITAITNDTATTTDYITHDNTLTYSGTLTNFDSTSTDKVLLELKNSSNVVVGSATVVPSNGTWTWVDPVVALGLTRPDGTYSLVSTIVNANGVRVNPTAPVNGTNGGQDTQVIVIDTAATNGGLAPGVVITTDTNDNGIVNAAELASATTFTVHGTFDPTKVAVGDKVVFTDGTTSQTVTLTSTDIANGYAVTTFPKPAEGATLTVTATIVDVAGNSTPVSAPDSATLDTSVITTTVAYSSMTKDTGINTGGAAINANINPAYWTTSDTSAGRLVSGSISAALTTGQSVEVYANGVKIGNAVVNGTQWEITDLTGYGTNASWTYTAQVVNTAGTTGPVATQLVNTDFVESAPTITSVRDTANAAVGATGTNSGNLNPTSNALSSVSGSASAGAAAAGSMIYLYDNSNTNLVGSAVVDGSGNWTVSGLNITIAANQFAAKQVDVNGNESPLSNLWTVNTTANGITNGNFSSDLTGFTTDVLRVDQTNPAAYEKMDFIRGANRYSVIDLVPNRGGLVSGALPGTAGWNTTQYPNPGVTTQSATQNWAAGTWSENVYVGSDANYVESSAWGTFYSMASGKILGGSADGLTSDNSTIASSAANPGHLWKSPVDVIAGQTYKFSFVYWNTTSKDLTTPGFMDVTIDGQVAMTTKNSSAGRVTVTYTATKTGTIDLSLDTWSGSNSADYALDNITFNQIEPADGTLVPGGTPPATPQPDNLTYEGGPINAMESNDVINVSSTGLQSMLTGGNGYINGGAGMDTLKLAPGTTLNLENLTRNQTVQPIQQVEIFQLQGSSNLTLSANDVLSLGGANATTMSAFTFTSSTGGTASASSAGKVQFVVNGLSSDTVNLGVLTNDAVLTNGVLGNTGLAGAWADMGTTIIGSTTYHVYNHSTTQAQVLVAGAAVNTPTTTQSVLITRADSNAASVNYVEEFTAGTGTTAVNTFAKTIDTQAWTITATDILSGEALVPELKLTTGASALTYVNTGMGTDAKLIIGPDTGAGSNSEPRVNTFTSKAGDFTGISFNYIELNSSYTHNTNGGSLVKFYDADGVLVHSALFTVPLSVGTGTLGTYSLALPAGLTASSFSIQTNTNDQWFMDGLTMTTAASSYLAHTDATVDSTPLLTGTYASNLNVGDVVKVYDGSTYVGTATVDPLTKTWTLQLTTPQAVGSHTYVAKIESSASATVATSNNYNLNTLASELNITAISTDSGTPADFITSDNTIVYDGQLPAALATGEKVLVKVFAADGTTLVRSGLATVATGATTWTWTDPGAALADGNYVIKATIVATDGVTPVASYGTRGTDTQPMTIDASVPTQTVTITSMTKDSGIASGNADWTTADGSAGRLVSGSVSAALAANEVVKVYANGTEIGQATVSGTQWTITDPAAYNANWTYTAKVVDSAGGTGPVSATTSVTLDTTESAVTISSVMESGGTVAITDGTGAVGSGKVITTVSGTGGTVGDIVYVYDNSSTNLIGSATVAAGGAWSLTGLTVPAGAHTFAAVQRDALGNISPNSNLFKLAPTAIDTTGNMLANVTLAEEGGYSLSQSSLTNSSLNLYPGYATNSGPGMETFRVFFTAGGMSSVSLTFGVSPDVQFAQLNDPTVIKFFNAKGEQLSMMQNGVMVPQLRIIDGTKTFNTGTFLNGEVATRMEIAEGGAQSFTITKLGLTPGDSNTLTATSPLGVVGTSGIDAMTYNGGAMSGLAGDDVISAKVATVQAQLAAGGIVNGGAGVDTLKLQAGTVLDLTAITGNQTVKNIQEVEVFQMQGKSTLTMSANDVLSLGATDLVGYSFAGTNGGTSTSSAGKVQFVVQGTSTDKFNLSALAGDALGSNTGTLQGDWVAKGTVAIGGLTYSVYDHSTSKAQVLVGGGVQTSVASTDIAISSMTLDTGAADFITSNGTAGRTVTGTISSALSGTDRVEVYADGVLIGNATVASGATTWTITDSNAHNANWTYTAKVIRASGATASAGVGVLFDGTEAAPAITSVTDASGNALASTAVTSGNLLGQASGAYNAATADSAFTVSHIYQNAYNGNSSTSTAGPMTINPAGAYYMQYWSDGDLYDAQNTSGPGSMIEIASKNLVTVTQGQAYTMAFDALAQPNTVSSGIGFGNQYHATQIKWVLLDANGKFAADLTPWYSSAGQVENNASAYGEAIRLKDQWTYWTDQQTYVNNYVSTLPTGEYRVAMAYDGGPLDLMLDRFYFGVAKNPVNTVTGTGTPGSLIQLFDNGGTTAVGSTTVAADGTWTVSGMNLAAGTHNFTAKSTDGAGNVSVASVAYNATVTPVALDLNGDGQIGYSQIKMDLNADGVLDATAWVAAQDGLLMHDLQGDGSVRSTSQFAFARHAGETDLQGLAAQFDSNHDGVLNALDAQFGEMAVWQDANQNGVADAGEVKHLAELGIHAIQLTSDGVVRTPTAGVTEYGHSSAQLANGSDMLVADAAFAFQAPQAADVLQAAGNALTFKAADTVVDLASFVAHNTSGSVAQVDLTGTGDNTLRLSLSDVLQQATASGQALQVKGNAGDVVELFKQGAAPVQTSSTLNGNDYAAFDLDRNGSVDLLVDQAVRVSLG